MNTNPYAPPSATVADLAQGDGSLPRRSKVVVIVAVNAGLVGVASLLGAIFSAISLSAQGRSIAGNIAIGCSGLVAVASAIDIFRHRRWAAIVWFALCGFSVALPLLAVPMKSRADYVVMGFLIAQFVGSLLALWAIVQASQRNLPPEIAQPQLPH